ncbi:MAG: hypothetical protein V4689_06065 [Verrucomicrobiota bacterium]
MDDRNIRRFERATRVQTFGRDNAADFTAGSKLTDFFADLDPIVLELTDARVGQLRDIVGKPALIDALSLDFKDVSRTSRAIKLDEPGFDDSAYRHPATSSETPVTTHADSLLNSSRTTPAPSRMAATPRPSSPPRPRSAPSSSPTNSPPTSSQTSAATATPSISATPANTATILKASKAPPPSRPSSATPKPSSPASTPPSKTNTAAPPTNSPLGKAHRAPSARRRKR